MMKLRNFVAELHRVAAIRVTPAAAIIFAAAMIAAALLLAPMVAPYRFQAAALGGFWRFNAITGEAIICLSEDNVFDLICSWPYQPKARPARETK